MTKIFTLNEDTQTNGQMVAEGQVACGFARKALIAFGCLNVVFGLIGVILPGVPTTVFLILATWAFSKSSTRFHHWIWNHPIFGPPVQGWTKDRVIPFRAKIAAISMMSLSFLYVTFAVAENWVLPLIMASILVPTAIFIASCASAPATHHSLQQ